MKSERPLGSATLLPSTANRKHKNAQSSRASKPPLPASPAPEQNPAFVSLAEVIFRDRTWPRTFTLPSLVRYHDYQAETLVAQLALAFHSIEAEMHDLIATLAQTRPTEAAALAEAVAILEQCACMEGLATALDDTPSKGESPALRLAALAKVQALNRRHK